MERTQCSETSAFNTQTPEKCPEDNLSIRITYFECVFVGSVVQHVKRMLRVVKCGLFGITIFFPHYLINATILEIKLLNIKYAI